MRSAVDRQLRRQFVEITRDQLARGVEKSGEIQFSQVPGEPQIELARQLRLRPIDDFGDLVDENRF